MITRRSLVLAALAGLAVPLAACGSGPQRPKLTVGPLTTLNTLSLATASGRMREALAPHGELEVTAPFPAFAPAAEALAARRIDVTTGSSTSFVTALVGNPAMRVFAIEDNDNDTQGIVAAPGSGITSIPALAGRTVAINKGGTGEYLLRKALHKHGLQLADVRPTYLGPADAAGPFAAGQVDAWATWDQYLVTAELTPGARLLALARDVAAPNRTVHVCSAAAWAEAEPLIRAAYSALADQARAIVADPALLESEYRKAGATAEVARAIAAKRPPSIMPATATYAAELAAVAEFYVAEGMSKERIDTTGATVAADS